MISESPLPQGSLFKLTGLLFDPNLSDPLKVTLLQLVFLSLGSPAHQTPPLSYDHLQLLTGKPVRTMRGHITALRDHHAALDTLRADAGQFIIVLADRFFSEPAAEMSPDPPGARPKAGGLAVYPRLKSARGRSSPNLVIKEEESNPSADIDLNLLLKTHNGQKMARTRPGQYSQRKPRGRPGSQPDLSQAMANLLLDAGVYPSLLKEIAASSYSEEDLGALLEWCREDQPENPAPLLIARLRNGARPPLRFREPPCPACGQRGKHEEGCYKRY